MSGRFNPNKALDFAALTNSVAADAILTALQLNKSRWRLSEGAYFGGGEDGQLVLFHILSSVEDYQGALQHAVDRGGRRKVKYQFPYRDGQTTDDLGRKGENFHLDILLYGQEYQDGLVRLMKELHRPQPGRLIHPIRGSITCGLEDVQLSHTYETRSAVQLHLVLTEHNFFEARFGRRKRVGSSIGKALAVATAVAQGVATAIAVVRAVVSIVQQIRRAIADKITEFKNFFDSFNVDANITFNAGAGSLPGLLPQTQGGLASPSQSKNGTAVTAGVAGSVIQSGGYIRVGTRFITVLAPNDPLANLPAELLSESGRLAVAVTQLQQRVELLRQMADEILEDIDAAGVEASLTLHEQKLAIKRAAIAAQNVLEAGMASSRARIVTYTVPRVMSIREVAFQNGLTPNQCGDIEVMNPAIPSVNMIAKGTVLKVPVGG